MGKESGNRRTCRSAIAIDYVAVRSVNSVLMQYVPAPDIYLVREGKRRHGGHTNSMGQITAYSKFLPAAGWRNGSSSNNVGSNGNYWSSTLNSSNSNNARNLNFNSGNKNVNNNNRYNGQSVRPVVSEFTNFDSFPYYKTAKDGPDKLLLDIYRAYKDARRHKRYKRSQLLFELDMEAALVRLYSEIKEKRFHPGRAICFIIHEPKMREVFAAPFRDRVVHHLLYNYIHSFFESTFKILTAV